MDCSIDFATSPTMDCSTDYPSPSTSLDLAARLNNKGAEFLGAGDFKHARDLFRKALASLTASTRASLESSSNNKNDDSNQEPRLTGSSMEFITLFPKNIAPKRESNVPDAAIIYSQAIPVPPAQYSSASCLAAQQHDQAFSQSLSSACCIFNLALIYHIRGMTQTAPSRYSSTKQEGGNQRERLLKARALYDKCAHLVFSQGLGGFVGAHPIADLLSMAVMNNIAHVCCELACYDAARSSVDGLLYVASLVNPKTYGNEEVAAVIHKAKQNFCLNTLMLQPPSVAHAA